MKRTWTIIGVADVPQSFKWYSVRVIESHAICDAPAAIMARHTESRKAQALHHLDHIPRHCSLRVRRVIWLDDGLPLAP
jgi:hypothetical protein